MQKNKIVWILGIVSIICLGLIFHMFWAEPNTNSPVDKKAQQNLIDFDGVDLKEERDGKIIWLVKAKNIKYDPETKDIFLEKVEAQFNDGGTELMIKADKGSVTDHNRVINLEGSIYGKNTSGVEFKAKSLKYDAHNGNFSTDQEFYYKDGSNVLTADSLQGNMTLNKIVAKGHVRLLKE